VLAFFGSFEKKLRRKAPRKFSRSTALCGYRARKEPAMEQETSSTPLLLAVLNVSKSTLARSEGKTAMV